jgi:hypothetical protein
MYNYAHKLLGIELMNAEQSETVVAGTVRTEYVMPCCVVGVMSGTVVECLGGCLCLCGAAVCCSITYSDDTASYVNNLIMDR